MAKRTGQNFLENESKKQKLNDHNDSLWDDDVDDDSFEKIANKLLDRVDLNNMPPTQGNNSILPSGNNSILPSYETFRPHIAFASTQSIASKGTGQFSQSINTNDLIVEDLKVKVKYLEQKCEAKEGEVSILRTQMQKIKTEMLEDQNKKQKEYIEYANLKEKELKNIKGELEFKNLEIANIKQSALELTKTNSNLNHCLGNCKYSRMENGTRNISPAKNRLLKTSKNKEKEKSVVTDILLEPDFPLHSKFSPDFFETIPPEVHILETRISQQGRNTIPYLHNQVEQEEHILPTGPKVSVKIGKKHYGLDLIYPEMFKITQRDRISLSSSENKLSINKILVMSIQLLENLSQYLELLEKSYKTDEIEQLDRNNFQNKLIQFDYKLAEELNVECEIGTNAARTVNFLAELLPYSHYLSECIIENKPIDFGENIREHFSCLKNIHKRKNYYLSLINDVVRKIFILGKTEVCNAFLNAVGSLLLMISRHNLYNQIASLFNVLFGSLLFTRPQMNVMHNLLLVVKNCCKYKPFLEFLCRQSMNQTFTADKKKKVYYFGEDTCKFTVFMVLLRNKLSNVKEEETKLDVTVNVFSIVYNLFKINPSWMHDSHMDACMCLEQLYELAVEVLYGTFLQFKNNRYNTIRKGKYILIFNSGIEVLQLLSFNSYGLVEKCIESDSRYRAICCGLLEFEKELNLKEEIEDLQKLSLCEDVPNVPSANFDLL